MSFVPYAQPSSQRRQPLDRPRIVAAALAVMDEVGVDGLTMRRVADQLGVTAAGLYRHVRAKDELLAMLADEISGQVPTVTPGTPWQAALTEMAVGYRRVLLEHRDAARLLASTPPAGPERLRQIEAILRVLVEAGFSGRDAAWAAYHFNNVVTEFVADEVRLGDTPRTEVMAQARSLLRSLPRDEFPTLTTFAEHIATDDAEGLFAFGVRLCLTGLEHLRQTE
ncbi:MAG TPA: TetR/AcrR family transcriptional regulator C-terminal domain-containing protein [Chloroflexota bacterium]|jgi:AcrR family transcriptional regulator